MALLGVGCVSAAETQWIGASAGNWSDAPNWSAGAPNTNTVAVIPVSGSMTIKITSGVYAMLQGLRATGEGTLTIKSSGNGHYFGKDANGACVVDVDEGVTVSADSTFQGALQNLRPLFVKTGRGALCLIRDATYTGPTRVTGGLLREDGTSVLGTPFGFGSAILDDGALLFGNNTAPFAVATNDGCTVSYDGVSAVGFFNGTGGTLTVRNVSGSGVVKNGTLVVLGEDNRRSPATFIILR